MRKGRGRECTFTAALAGHTILVINPTLCFSSPILLYLFKIFFSPLPLPSLPPHIHHLSLFLFLPSLIFSSRTIDRNYSLHSQAESKRYNVINNATRNHIFRYRTFFYPLSSSLSLATLDDITDPIGTRLLARNTIGRRRRRRRYARTRGRFFRGSASLIVLDSR